MKIRVRTQGASVRRRVDMIFTREWREVDVTRSELNAVRDDRELQYEIIARPENHLGSEDSPESGNEASPAQGARARKRRGQ